MEWGKALEMLERLQCEATSAISKLLGNGIYKRIFNGELETRNKIKYCYFPLKYQILYKLVFCQTELVIMFLLIDKEAYFLSHKKTSTNVYKI